MPAPGVTLEYRVKRIGRGWCAFLRRPASDRPLFYEAATKRDAITALLNGVAKMARDAPGRLWPKEPAPPVAN